MYVDWNLIAAVTSAWLNLALKYGMAVEDLGVGT